MHIEIDQSGKIEQTNTDTILALSNRVQRTIRIPSTVKRETIRILRAQGMTPETYYLKIFCAGILILLKPILGGDQEILIDREYKGKDGTIKLFLLQMAKKNGLRIRKEQLTIGHIGKKSKAHKLAWSLRRKRKGEDEKINLEQLLSLMS